MSRAVLGVAIAIVLLLGIAALIMGPRGRDGVPSATPTVEELSPSPTSGFSPSPFQTSPSPSPFAISPSPTETISPFQSPTTSPTTQPTTSPGGGQTGGGTEGTANTGPGFAAWLGLLPLLAGGGLYRLTRPRRR